MKSNCKKAYSASMKFIGSRLNQAWLCFSVAFFLFYARLRSFTSSGNRLEIGWTPIDMGMVYLAVLVIACFLFLGWWVLKRMGLSRELMDRGFILISFFSVGYAVSVFVVNDVVMSWIGPFEAFNFDQSSKTYFYGPFVTGLLRYLFILVLAYGITLGVKPVKKFLTLLIFTISPVALVYPLVALSYDSVPMRRGVQASGRLDDSGMDKRVFFFLFDMWDYQNTFRNGSGAPKLDGLEKLRSISTLYHNAISPSTFTNKSVSKMIGGYGKDSSNLFTSARAAGWRSAIVAGYLPYQVWYGPFVDYCLRVVWYKMDAGAVRWAYFEIKEAIDAAFAFWAPEWSEPRDFSKDARYHSYQTKKVHENVIEMIKNAEGNSLNYFHYPVPHSPFFIEPELRAHGVPSKEAQVRGYRNNLEVMDKCIDDIITVLKESHRWENSLIIFTGDHGWRMDPIKPRPLSENRHVPLFIKYPGQKERRDIYESYDMENLKMIIEKELLSSKK